jgi:hypothetical protein
MKKFISFSLMVFLSSAIFAQEVDTRDVPLQKKSNSKKIKAEAKPVSLEGRSFKVTFTEKQLETKSTADTKSSNAEIKDNHDALPADKPDYSMFDANSKVILTFSNGNLLSPIFSDAGCPYHVNTSGGDLVAFSASCKLNSGNEHLRNGNASGHDTKMEIDAYNSGKTAGDISEQHSIEAVPSQTMPADETKQHLPPGTARDDNAGMNNNTAPATEQLPPSSTRTEEIQRQTESPVSNQQHEMMATISGLVSGNTIQGTLSWTGTDGKKIAYSYSGNVASKKDTDDSRVVGMK